MDSSVGYTDAPVLLEDLDFAAALGGSSASGPKKKKKSQKSSLKDGKFVSDLVFSDGYV